VRSRHTRTIERDPTALHGFITDALNAPWWLLPVTAADAPGARGPDWCTVSSGATRLADIAWDVSASDPVLLADNVVDEVFEARAEFTVDGNPTGHSELTCEPQVADHGPRDGRLRRLARRRRRKRSRERWEARLAELEQVFDWGLDRSGRETRQLPTRRLDDGLF
jgi:hypothetical protein